MITIAFPVRIMGRSKSASERLRKLMQRFDADACHPLEYRCMRCGQEWGDAVLTDHREVTCSNCYSERVLLTKVRLGFENWGKQNGGKAQQITRRDAALVAAAPQSLKDK